MGGIDCRQVAPWNSRLVAVVHLVGLARHTRSIGRFNDEHGAARPHHVVEPHPTDFSDDSSSEIENLNPGQYIVEVTDDLGCIIYDTVEVLSNPKECITIYKAFSPNDDEVNEFWQIENIHLYPKALIMVFDRNGREVFRRRNYQNSEDIAFSGKDKDSRVLPSGTYYYVINLENGDQVLKGTVTILR